ncbi:predicted protein [Sclerotinia sclerotiorum 1980 UF-70]|uniref:Uncharacterized protein n=1 Tax=Sclerotinia sclerotiorum (strain ATCC 18683 / 1980 / Ss-1) TaxID=665079 RepID=A7F543_SCLS1|nr:predicted protein [Sclerotinia sclerotiorum 1980 UF-70]EDN97864.1 predicted protein [Sclerotinia sclerotiorum 1980 UF-70]
MAFAHIKAPVLDTPLPFNRSRRLMKRFRQLYFCVELSFEIASNDNGGKNSG